jgi:hypothetical protein
MVERKVKARTMTMEKIADKVKGRVEDKVANEVENEVEIVDDMGEGTGG